MKKITILFALLMLTSISAQDLDTIVNVGDYNMHFIIKKGKGNPIVFESGSGNDATIWKDIVNPIAEKTNTTIITYDRIGFGKSSIQKNAQHKEHGILSNVTALEKGLLKLGYAKNITFISHSLGGFYTRLYVARNTKRIKSVIFLDASMPSFYTKDFMNRMNKIMSTAFLTKIKSSSIGLYHELKNINETVRFIKSIDFPNSIPVLSLEAEKAFNPLKNESDGFRWKKSHADFTSKNNNRERLEIKASTHYVFKSQSKMVINKISDYYNKN
ncbi:MAG: pimeloyl-ACP methyl ester carboxylesterase [Flavobacteriales bacterium]|jgi:pimeloyl-ACP methyl ester carboxylesterase